MSNKHFTTSDVRKRRVDEERRVRAARLKREEERRSLLHLQRKFDLRAGRVR